jgi:ubiquinone/menaquinone biosynthesis C-methylase UbiE
MPAEKLKRHQRDWEELAEFNPEWAVLTEPGAKFDGWEMEEFFATGAAAIASLLKEGEEIALPESHRRVLDFGCGVGRLSRALAGRFERYVGIDISAGMVERARELNADLPNAEYVVSADEDLRRFEDQSFDAVVSLLVLQHVPGRELIRTYLREFGRVLAPGGLIVVQVPSHVPLAYRLRVRRRLYRLARAVGVSVERAHRWGLQSMWFQALPESDVTAQFEASGCQVRRAETEQIEALGGVHSTTYFVTRSP